MGCDIHLFVETYENGCWNKVGKVFEDTFYERKTDEPYLGRNYLLFGFLAGVRRDCILPVALPKGVPEDASEGYKAIVKQWSGDGHSSSYYTLQELAEYPLYDELVTLDGTVGIEGYKEFKEKGKPSSYCGSAFGNQVVNITNWQMDEYLANPEEYVKQNGKKFLYDKMNEYTRHWKNTPAYEMLKKTVEEAENGNLPQFSFHTLVEWKQSVRDCLGEYWWKMLERIKELAPEGDLNKVRLVFFFDN